MRKLNFITSIIEEANTPDGTFVGVNLSDETKDALIKAAKDMKVPNIIGKKDLHITVIYSRKYLPKFEARGEIDPPMVCSPSELEIFTGQDGTTKALVVRVDCPELVERHKKIMKEHEATYDFDEYKPHITLSYNCEEFDPETNDINEHLEKPFIEIVEEYSQDLDLDWVDKNTED